jgi:hypothetical protein
MSTVIETKVQFLSDQILPHLLKMLLSSESSSGDLSVAEGAIGVALNSVRSLMVDAALEVSGQSAQSSWSCPSCKKRMGAWTTRKNTVVTRHGSGRLAVTRYRCRSCCADFYPLQVLNDLRGTQFTIGARELIATEAADGAFAQASARLDRMGVPVSPSEVERISDDIGKMRKEEEELVRLHLNARNRDLNLPLYRWDDWTRGIARAKHAIMSVDGAKIRSDKAGSKGLEWFEVRSGVLTLPGGGAPKAQIAGDISPEALFEAMQSIWRQSPLRHLDLVFVADGAEWIWERVNVFLPTAIQMLDIYHAAEHVASAGRAAWGDDDPRTKRWIRDAVAMLRDDGPNPILRELLATRKNEAVCDLDELKRNIRYLWRHRRRMKYLRWKEMGLTIGSGAMESSIKQVSTMRLRRPGMMWTKAGADLMLRLRAAVLSGSLDLTIDRHKTICANRTQDYRIAV